MRANNGDAKNDLDGYYSLRLPYAVNRKSPMPFRPSELVERMIERALVEGVGALPPDVAAALGDGELNRNQIINACISVALASDGLLTRMAARGAVSPNVLGEIARISANCAKPTAGAHETTSAKLAKHRLARRAVRRSVRDSARAAKQPSN